MSRNRASRRPWRAALVGGVGAALVLAGLSAAAPVHASTNPIIDPTPRPFVSGWMPYYTTDASMASFTANADLFGDVTGFWHSATGATTITNQLADAPRAAAVAAVHAKGVKIIAAVTDGMGQWGMTAVLSTSAGRSAHVQALVDLAVANGYDGIDLDYEKFAFTDGSSTWAATRPRWVAFVNELAAALHAKGLWLTVSVPVMYDSDRDASSGYWVYDYAGIAASVDRLRIMTYDYSVSVAGPIAPIAWVHRVLDYAVTQVPSEKIQVGVPAYGRDWPSSTTGCPTSNLPARESPTSRAALALASSLGVSPVWVQSVAEKTFSYKKTYTGTTNGTPASCTITRTVWFEDNPAAITRARLVREYQLAGIAQWTIGGEDPAEWSRFRDYAAMIAKTSPRVTLYAGDVVYGHPLSVTATVRSSTGGAIAGAPWTLYWREAAATTWTKAASGTTTSAGNMYFTTSPSRSGYWKLGVSGSWAYYTAWTQEDRTSVAIAVSASFSKTTVKAGTAMTLSGSVGPDAAGLLVEHQSYSQGVWRTVGTTTTTRADGTFSQTLVPTVKGPYTYRVKVSGSQYRVAGYSQTLHLTVT